MDSDFNLSSKIEQKINGSRKLSNYLIGGMLTIGGVGFILASLSSYTGKDLLPLGNPSRPTKGFGKDMENTTDDSSYTYINMTTNNVFHRVNTDNGSRSTPRRSKKITKNDAWI